MDDAETVPAQDEVLEQAVEEAQEQAQEEAQEQEQHEEEREEQNVPLHALQKERKKRQEAEQRLQWLEEQSKKPQEDPEDQYESVTRGDLSQVETAFLRKVEERSWVKSHPDRYEYVNDKLPELLKKKPNLAYAIASAENRYEEAWDLLKAFEKGSSNAPRANHAPARRAAPNNPSAAPKAAGVNQAVDVMTMSDDEFQQWRQSKRKRR